MKVVIDYVTEELSVGAEEINCNTMLQALYISYQWMTNIGLPILRSTLVFDDGTRLEAYPDSPEQETIINKF